MWISFVLQLFHLKEVKQKLKFEITSNSNLFSLLVLSVVKEKEKGLLSPLCSRVVTCVCGHFWT